MLLPVYKGGVLLFVCTYKYYILLTFADCRVAFEEGQSRAGQPIVWSALLHWVIDLEQGSEGRVGLRVVL